MSILVVLMLGAACGGDGNEAQQIQNEAREAAERVGEEAKEAGDKVGEAAADASARGVAEALRAKLLGQELAEDQDLRRVAALQEAIADLPGDARVEGIEDADNDGRDDDGKVTVKVADQTACLSVAEDGKQVDVTGQAC